MPTRKALKETFAKANPRTLKTHTGLWIDKMLVGDEPSSKVASPHLQQIVRPPVPDGYEEAFAARKRSFGAAGVETLLARCDGRVAIGLGGKGVLEMGLTLDHTWGVPYLPGSALKGLCAAAAAKFGSDGWQRFEGWPEAKPEGSPAVWTNYEVLFGTTANSGVVVFHDAWWDPTEAEHVPIEMDVMTVHHPKYYQQADCLPTDFDEPVPIPFLSTTGTFMVALEGPTAWRTAAAQLLRVALRDLGIGAKTTSGYGRLTLEVSEAERLAAERTAEADRLAARRRKCEAVIREHSAATRANPATEVPRLHDEVDKALSSGAFTHEELRSLLTECLAPAHREVKRYLKDKPDSPHAKWLASMWTAPPDAAPSTPGAPTSAPNLAVLKTTQVRASVHVREKRRHLRFAIEGKTTDEDIGKLKPTDALKAMVKSLPEGAEFVLRVTTDATGRVQGIDQSDAGDRA